MVLRQLISGHLKIRDAKFPRPGIASQNDMPALAFEKASFFKIREVTLGYSLPKRLISKINVSATLEFMDLCRTILHSVILIIMIRNVEELFQILWQNRWCLELIWSFKLSKSQDYENKT